MTFYTLKNVPYPPDIPTDGSDKTHIISIAEYVTGHVMQFPAFIEKIKYNTTKELDYQSEADKWTKVVREYTGDFSIDITLTLPAASPQQARTNVAKLENLQKLLLNPDHDIPVISENDSFSHIESQFNTAIQKERKSVVGPLFKVAFANLIHGGKIALNNQGFSGGVLYNGFPCLIESVNFNPVIEMGFFEYEGPDFDYEFLYPKVLTLDLSLKLENKNEKLDLVPIGPLPKNSQDTLNVVTKNDNRDQARSLNTRDNMVFPFGTQTIGNEYKEAYTISKKLAYNRNYYIYIQRYGKKVLFPAFIEDFTRNFEANQNYIESKSNYVGKGADTGKLATPSKFSYSLSFSVPCASIEESLLFSKQIQLLMRMFYRKEEGSAGNFSERELGFNIYIPGLIESGGASKTFVGPSNDPSDGAEASSLSDLWMEDLNIEIESNMGFFNYGTSLLPKSYKISTSIVSGLNNTALIRPHLITEHRKDNYTTSSTSNVTDQFPFNRSTLKIGE